VTVWNELSPPLCGPSTPGLFFFTSVYPSFFFPLMRQGRISVPPHDFFPFFLDLFKFMRIVIPLLLVRAFDLRLPFLPELPLTVPRIRPRGGVSVLWRCGDGTSWFSPIGKAEMTIFLHSFSLEKSPPPLPSFVVGELYYSDSSQPPPPLRSHLFQPFVVQTGGPSREVMLFYFALFLFRLVIFWSDRVT